MARKAFVISAILIVVVVIISIIVSIIALINTKPPVFRPIVTYSEQSNARMEEPVKETKTVSENNPTFIESLLAHERIIMAGSIIVIIIFTLLFYGAKRSKS